jgi:uncharacterized protein (TIGR00251 family)
MKINVKVIPKSSMNRVETECSGEMRVKLTAAPEKNKANAALIDILAKHFNVSKSKVSILKGLTSRKKQVEVDL